jgi:tripartite-type tricarboxylate transporter receptor subunit TctC
MPNTWRLILASFGACIACAVFAQGYPERPIRLVVPFPPGGNIDITARAISPGLSELLGQQVVVDNRGGAGGTIGAEMVAKAPPDGYALLLGSTGTVTVAPLLYTKAPYDPLKDFSYVSLLSNVPLVVVIHPSIPAKTIKEFIALAKARPGRLTMASAGNGTTNHLGGELFQLQTGIKMVHVPYKGSGPALVDLMGGQVDVMFDQLSSSSAYIKSGKLRALAVTTPARAALFPSIPTLDESGVKGADANTFSGLMAPAGTPREIINKLNAATVKVISRPATKERFASFGAEVWSSTPEHFAAYVRDDFARWKKVVAAAGVKVE